MNLNRREDKPRKPAVKLQGRAIPRNAQGDPEFVSLSQLQSAFTDDEIVSLCNQRLYQMEYQQVVHRERAQRERDELAPVKAKVKEMFRVSWLKATEKQIDEAWKALNQEQEVKSGREQERKQIA